MGEGVTAYKEVTLASEIARELMEAGFLGAPETNGSQGTCLDDLVLENAGFHSFASFRTNREKFRCVCVLVVTHNHTSRELLVHIRIHRLPMLGILAPLETRQR